jgi:uncharacterized membrane-anchored protein YitT (DUF2179 family)
MIEDKLLSVKGGLFILKHDLFLKESHPLLYINTSIKELSRIGILVCGATLQGSAMALFLFPHHVPSGGAAGLALLFNHWFGLSLGWSIWLINFSMLAIAFIYFGLTWTFRTMFAVTIASFTVHTLEAWVKAPLHPLTVDLLLGGVLFGLGVGLLVKHGASSGGMLIPALMISAVKKVGPGQAMFWINFTIFILTAFVLDGRIVIYAIICQWVSTKVIDLNNT